MRLLSQNLIRIIGILHLSIFFPLSVWSQLYNFKKYGTKDGIPNPNVKQSLQTKNGYLWMATQGGGLSRFDGNSFKNYTKKDGLVSNDINCLEEDSEGNLWIGTVEGVCFFNGIKFISPEIEHKIGKTTVYQIYKDSKGNIWVATYDHGLFIIKKDKSCIKLDTSNGLSKNSIFAIIEDSENSFWVSTYKGGIYNISGQGKILSHIPKITEAPNASVFCFHKNRKNEIFAGTNNSGIFKFNRNSFERVKIEGLDNEFIGSIASDGLGNLWIGSENKGLVKFNPKEIKFFMEQDGLSSNTVNSLTLDYEGNLWISTQTGGVCMLRNDAVFTYTTKNGLNNAAVNSVCRTKDGDLLACTNGNGICKFDFNEGIFKELVLSESVSNSLLLSIHQTNDGKILCGTNSTGVIILKKNKNTYQLEKHITKIDGHIISTPITGIVPLSDGGFWFCTFGDGLYLMDSNGELKEKITNKKDLTTNELTAIHSDYKDNFYIAQFTNEIVTYKDNRVLKAFNDSPSDMTICWTISSDKKGNIFFGTQDGGLIIYSEGKFIQYDIDDGLSSNYIQSIVAGINGEIWVGSDKGVNRIEFDENLKIKSLRTYSTSEGLISPEVSHNGMIMDSQGFLWICTNQGLTRFDVKNDKPIETPPKLTLTEIRLHYEHVDWSKFSNEVLLGSNIPVNLILPYNENHLTFNYQALTTDHVKYKFYMENLDDNWSPLTQNNQAVYTNIPPGRYIFRVKAINSFGIESDDEVVFSFEIKPPFWKTWWFYLICGLVISSGFFLFFKWRTAKLEREKKLLEGKVHERTLELKDANDNLSVALHDIKDSINYAERIQRAMLPMEEKIHHYLPNSFILFKPRDIVSGDFYWFNHKDGLDYVAAADCTGHGVPGAFMSLVGTSLLNEIVLTKGLSDPSDVLSQLNAGVQNSLKQKENNTRDGMDLAFCSVDLNAKKLVYAGANRSLWIIRKGEEKVEEIKATKSAIGGFTDEGQHFQQHEIHLNKGDSVYMHSDGYADQFGGPDGKKLMTKRFKDILRGIQHLTMDQQKLHLEEQIQSWMGKNHEQVDDILIIGLRF
ncbi:MAG: two-component regulator propeller domain-containing protein [Bacteroidota bacterium]|jgi:ligand-binding sensor domain-containing protein/serine phosphatase RsbU (regulator of sigma subunit)